jgi:hypothetical protein
LQEDGLSSSGLAADEHQPSFGAGLDGGEEVVERSKMVRSLEQLV